MLRTVNLEDSVLVDLHRAASLAGRPGIAVPSLDLNVASERIGREKARGALKRLLQSQRVIRVRKDLVVLPEATGRMAVGLPELIKVVAPSAHLITGGRALEEIRLTNQHFFSVTVLVPKQTTGFSFRRETAVFLTTEVEHIWGWQKNGPHFALPERAILDAVSSSRYGVSMPMAIEALRSAANREPRFFQRLIKATRRYDSSTVARRIGLLVERQFGKETAAPFLELIGESRTPVLLRSGGPKKGPVDRAWRVTVNVSTDLGGAQP
jgi:predicted transcriptional regulator of viral defense system